MTDVSAKGRHLLSHPIFLKAELSNHAAWKPPIIRALAIPQFRKFSREIYSPEFSLKKG
jgi:hypothetical protein